jgi:hypothetical protein
MSTHHNGFTRRLMAFVKDRPGEWLPATTFEQFGRQGWRTRISDARQRFEAAHDGTIENRVRRPGRIDGRVCGPLISEYRYVPQANGSDHSVGPGHNTNAAPSGRLL